jgi:DNA-binding transcriptional ArsR family regulator
MQISDPRRVRALAHPLRWTLLELLADGEMTATECADATGESPASCSFHLRSLAKYGYITAGERRGRERPWRLATRSRDIRPDHDDRSSVRAVAEIAVVALDREVDRVRAWIERAGVEDPEWIDSSTITTASTWVTAAEFAELSSAIQRLTEPFEGRNEDPARRPEGARPVRILGVSHVDVAREARLGPDRRS